MSLRTFFYDSYFEMSLAFVCLLYIIWHWQNDIDHVFGSTLAILSFSLWIKARYDLGASYSILPTASHLITNGIYSKIRHPMYLFSTLVLLGIVITLEQKVLLVLPVFLLVVQYLRAKREDQILLTRYGNMFTNYKKRTWYGK